MAGLFTTLVLLAMTVGSLHSLAPDHWVPFAALARAQGWPARKTIRITLACGIGHVTASAVLGLLGLAFGMTVLRSLGQRMEAVAGILLVAFGLAYAAWGIRRAAGQHLHGHAHGHYDHVHDPSRMTAWGLFLLFSADPCVAVIPVMFAAAPLGALPTVALVVLYELATLATMVGLVLPARAGAQLFKGEWINRYGDATAGGLIAVTGIVVTVLGW
jgi:nickel/cobalt transporter (NicO) family protein